ncbi:MAG: hypothetical protein ACR2I0_02665, partial [Rhodoferax sp.]
MFTHRFSVGVLFGASVLTNVYAQIATLSAADTIRAETSRTPKTSWLGKLEGWEKFEPRSYNVKRGDDSVQTLI